MMCWNETKILYAMCLGTQNIQNNVHIYNEFVQNVCTALHFTGVCERRTVNRWEWVRYWRNPSPKWTQLQTHQICSIDEPIHYHHIDSFIAEFLTDSPFFLTAKSNTLSNPRVPVQYSHAFFVHFISQEEGLSEKWFWDHFGTWSKYQASACHPRPQNG